jgi:hypothetical protein
MRMISSSRSSVVNFTRQAGPRTLPFIRSDLDVLQDLGAEDLRMA